MKYRHFQPSLLFAGLLLCSLQSRIFADGLAGEYLLTDRWRAFHSLHSPLANPAFLTEQNYLSLRGVFSPVLQNAFRLWEAGATLPIGLYHSVGVTVLGEDDGQIRGGYIDGSGNVVPSGMEEGNLSSLLLFSYAVNPWNKLSAGVNVAIAYQGNFGEPRKGVGLDVGVTYRLVNYPAFGYHLVGLTAQNLIAPSMGTEFTPDFNSRSQYARNLKASWIGAFFERQLDASVEVNLKDFLAQAEHFKAADATAPTGLSQAAKQLEYDCNVRVGAWVLRIFRLAASFGVGENEERYLSVAGGVNIPGANNGRDLEALYQYTSMLHGAQASGHSIYLRGDVGNHREENYAKKVAVGLDLSPNELYNKACKLYFAGNYWDAFFVFGQILALFPDFFKNDWVSYYMGSCQERMDMRVSGRNRLERMLEEYPQSDAIHFAELGLMRIAYRENDILGVSREFQKLIRIGVPDSLKFHACYLMAQTHMREKEFAKAIQFLSAIPSDHPQYVYAQHSLAICHVIRGEYEKAKEALDHAVSADVRTAAQKEMVNRSYLMAGYLYYEEQALSKAVAALRKVPATSYYYEDALLGLGWSALKARQWADCGAAGQILQTVTKKPVVQCEAILLEAVPLIMSKDYAAAVTVLRKAGEKLPSLTPPSRDTLAMRTNRYHNDRSRYEGVGRSADELSGARQSAMGVKTIDSLHAQQVSIKAAIDDFMRYQDEFGRSLFFSNNIDNVKGDINYVLATAEKLRAQAGKDDGKRIEQQKQLDDEIKKLKEQMKKLEGKQ